MSLNFIRVDHEFSDDKSLSEMMIRQFPPEEYLSLEKQLELQDKGDVEIWALYADNELVGFATLRISDGMVYLFFLAFDDAFQGKGYGREAVQTIGGMYPDRAFAVDFELVDKKADNNVQRIRRRNFYLKNGFAETGWGLQYFGVQYEIFCMNKPFDLNSFQTMLDGLPIKGFCPQYFKI